LDSSGLGRWRRARQIGTEAEWRPGARQSEGDPVAGSLAGELLYTLRKEAGVAERHEQGKTADQLPAVALGCGLKNQAARSGSRGLQPLG
jgi:hypothetical protein